MTYKLEGFIEIQLEFQSVKVRYFVMLVRIDEYHLNFYFDGWLINVLLFSLKLENIPKERGH